MSFFRKSVPETAIPASPARPTILVVSDDLEILDMVHSIFASLVGMDVEGISMAQFCDRKKFNIDAYELAVIDVATGECLSRPDFLAARERVRGLACMFISAELGGEQMRQLIKLDGIDWLKKPLAKREFIETVLAYAKKVKGTGGQVQAVLSSGGGSGGTSVAVSMAYNHAMRRKRIGNGVALFDLDFSKASCGAYLNLPNEYNFDTVLDQPERVDIEFVELITKRHASGMAIYSFYKPEIGIVNQGRDIVLRMLDVVAYQNDQTVIDLPFYETAWKDSVIQSVNSLQIVTTSTVPSLEMAKLNYVRVTKLRNSTDNVTILVNRHKRALFGTEPGRAQVEKIFGATPVEFLPEEHDVMVEAVNRGVLPVEVNGSSRFNAAISSIVKNAKAKAPA